MINDFGDKINAVDYLLHEEKARAKRFCTRPDMPIILCTGFSEIITEEKAKSLGIREFVMKPIVKNEI